MADSKLLAGARPVASISVSCVSLQLSFVIVTESARAMQLQRGIRRSAPGTPKFVNEGPMARTITLFGAFPVTIKPPMRALSPVNTRNRVEMLSSLVVDGGVGVGVGVIIGVELRSTSEWRLRLPLQLA